MTADAKVGLLLGLVFIVIIAFLVNGLPNFLQTASAEDVVTNNITTETGPDLVIGDVLVEKARSLDRTIPLRQSEPPQEVTVIHGAGENTVAPQAQQVQTPTYTPPVQHEQPNPFKTVTPSPVRETIRQTTSAKTKVHVVKSGENLAVIAQKYYGDDEGNRRVVIQKLYEANTGVLEAPSKIRVGDKINVPTLEQLFSAASQPVQSKSTQDASESLLSKFSNMFERADKNDKPKYTEYVVKEGESLWAIAAEQLGNGNRYKEIVKLNKMKNANEVVAGKVIRLPR